MKTSNCVYLKITFILLLCNLTTLASDIATKLEAEGIIPDTLDVAPAAKVTVIFAGNKRVELGTELTPTEVKEQPQVSWDANPAKYYTLSLVDPDAPSRQNPTLREMNHWLVVNIKGSDLSTGQTLIRYGRAMPPKGSGFHRYIMTIFEQKEKNTIEQEDLKTDRRNFSIRKFAKKYNLGQPSAVNFFVGQWDSSVPERRN